MCVTRRRYSRRGILVGSEDRCTRHVKFTEAQFSRGCSPTERGAGRFPNVPRGIGYLQLHSFQKFKGGGLYICGIRLTLVNPNQWVGQDHLVRN
ncbi:hypothetical protein FKM82_027549 [Ascaphus truei]